jgi:hypothetical protein
LRSLWLLFRCSVAIVLFSSTRNESLPRHLKGLDRPSFAIFVFFVAITPFLLRLFACSPRVASHSFSA